LAVVLPVVKAKAGIPSVINITSCAGHLKQAAQHSLPRSFSSVKACKMKFEMAQKNYTKLCSLGGER
jgi:hypothetical protein